MTNKKILDACCGSKMFWFDKENPNVVFCDNRNISETLCDGRKLIISPDVVADFKDLPFDDESFYLVVFDPPHLLKAGDSSWLVKKYGKLGDDWKSELKQGFDECMRVLKENGILIFKWSEVDIPVSEILKIFGYEPLFGHKSGRLNKTHWLCFMKDGKQKEGKE